MKKLTTIIAAIAAITTAAEAKLTPKQFEQLKQWGLRNSYSYEGPTENVGSMRLGTECYVFFNAATEIYGLVPVSSDTTDEAINALIASTLTCRAEFARREKDAKYAQAVTDIFAHAEAEKEAQAAAEPSAIAAPTTGVAQDIPAEVMAKIRIAAARDHPDDYSVQEYVIEEQVESFHFLSGYQPANIPPGVLDRIKAKAKKDHPYDYSVQQYVIEEQVEAYLNLHK
jgi:hypothetical protein